MPDLIFFLPGCTQQWWCSVMEQKQEYLHNRSSWAFVLSLVPFLHLAGWPAFLCCQQANAKLSSSSWFITKFIYDIGRMALAELLLRWCRTLFIGKSFSLALYVWLFALDGVRCEWNWQFNLHVRPFKLLLRQSRIRLSTVQCRRGTNWWSGQSILGQAINPVHKLTIDDICPAIGQLSRNWFVGAF